MVRILIVDDEVPIREWMAFCIGQMDLPCEIVGQASDGEEALRLFRDRQPDLIFTDIKMPGLDGIEFVRQVREAGSRARVVFLTSHAGFDYVRDALHLGAEAYILKTEIKAESIAEHIKICQGRLDESFSLQVRKQSVVPTLLQGGLSTLEQIQEELAQTGFPLQNAPLVTVAVQLSQPVPQDAPPPQPDLSREGLYENLCCFSYQGDILLVAANLPQSPSIILQTRTLAQFAETIGDYFRAPICVSALHPGLEHLREAVEQCIRCLGLLFYDNRPGRRLFCSLLKIPDPRELRERTEGLLEETNRGAATDLVEALLDYLRQAASPDIPLVKECVTRLLNAVATRRIKNTALFLEAAREIDLATAEAADFSSLAQSAMELAAQLEQGWKPAQNNRYSMHVSLAMEYVREHYGGPVSLSDAAEFVGISGEHLSRVFKQESGATFVEHLTSYRMDKAMELLKNTNLKIYEVAQRTGYPNMSYFSKTFKKQFGCTPFQIRSAAQEATTT